MSSGRLGWVDWLRGLAVLAMVEVHVLEGWSAPDVPHGLLFSQLRGFGGLAAPSFLFLAGLSQVFSDQALARRGVAPHERRASAIKRGLYVLGCAFAFRLFEYTAGLAMLVEGGYLGIFKVDILNCIGAGLVLSALGIGRGKPVQLAYALGLVLAFLALAPLAEVTGARLAGYLYDPQAFGLANWAAFLAAGHALGLVLDERPPGMRLLVLGTALLVAGVLLDHVPLPFGARDYWHSAPSWVLFRLGIVIMAGGALARLGLEPSGPLVYLGRNSLFAYMASVELTYGLSTRMLHRALPMSGVLAGIVVMVLATYGLVRLKERYLSTSTRPGQALRPSEPQVASSGTGT